MDNGKVRKMNFVIVPIKEVSLFQAMLIGVVWNYRKFQSRNSAWFGTGVTSDVVPVGAIDDVVPVGTVDDLVLPGNADELIETSYA